MTRQEALDYDNELKSKLALEAEILGLEESAGSSIVDNYIMVIPDDARKGMVFLGEEESFINDFSKWYKEKNENVPDPEEIGIAIENLCRWKVIAIDGGKIWLKETVMGVMEP